MVLVVVLIGVVIIRSGTVRKNIHRGSGSSNMKRSERVKTADSYGTTVLLCSMKVLAVIRISFSKYYLFVNV